jgi:NADP-dependent 3-hydroxy acid dehydrogenase YdfG
VALAARRVDRLDSLATRIREDGGRALAFEVDISSAEQAAGAVERTVSELGRLDILINNAGLMLLGPVLGAPLRSGSKCSTSTSPGCRTRRTLPFLTS